MHQNVVAFHATNRMLDKDADLTQGFIHSLLFIAQLRVRVLFTLARLFCRYVDLIVSSDLKLLSNEQGENVG